MGDTEKIKTVRISFPDDVPSGNDFLSRLPEKPQERYHFIRSIGFGGMKAVLLVDDADTGREIAMAIMPDFRERSKSDLERFVQEARLTALLEHPNIVPVHDIGVDHLGSPYFTMKYLRGQSLATILRKLRKGDVATRTRFHLVRMLQIFVRICNAIEFAHSRGVAHLDLKPDNINIGEYGEVLVLDWGVARVFSENADMPSPGSPIFGGHDNIKGTPGYMAPEQIRRSKKDPIGPAADIYALGGLLYAMLTWQNPLAGMDQDAVLRHTLSGEIPPPSSVLSDGCPSISAALEAVVLKAMNPEASLRYVSVSELREDIFAFQSGYATKAENASPLKHAGLFLSRNMVILLFILTFLLAIALLTLTYYYYQAL